MDIQDIQQLPVTDAPKKIYQKPELVSLDELQPENGVAEGADSASQEVAS